MDCRFDDFDVYYLANNLTVPQLREEIRSASNMNDNVKSFEQWPCQLISTALITHNDWGKRVGVYLLSWEIAKILAEYDFDYEGYLACCREAIKTIQDHNRKQPRPEAGGKRIDIEALKSRLDIVAEVERYTKLRKSGRNFTGLCPLHHDTSPSFTVYPDEQTWHCFGACNKGGDVIDFIMAAEGVDFKQAAFMLGAT